VCAVSSHGNSVRVQQQGEEDTEDARSTKVKNQAKTRFGKIQSDVHDAALWHTFK
jgi:hypothetical protein